MTRLTSQDIECVWDGADLDRRLTGMTGRGVRGIALESAGLPTDMDLSGFSVVCVPVTSGLGEIGGFAGSLDAIARHLGMSSRVSGSPDVAGFAEAVSLGADIVLMADDDRFIAYNTVTNTVSDNAYCTAMGYAVALRDAAEGLVGRRVLVMGAGFVGSEAVRILRGMNALVTVVDIDVPKARRLALSEGVQWEEDVSEAVSRHDLILNASPGTVPGTDMVPGTVVSSLGVPCRYDDEARRRARAIIHDPLEIGTAVMLTTAAAETVRRTGRVNIPVHGLEAVLGHRARFSRSSRIPQWIFIG